MVVVKQQRKNAHKAHSETRERSCSGAVRAARAGCRQRSHNVQQAPHLHHVFLHEGAEL